MNFFKQNWGKVIFSAIMLGLYFWHRDSFFVVTLIYLLGIYLIMEMPLSRRFWLIVVSTIWVVTVLVSGITIYVNYGLPRGSFYPTGMNTCEFSDRGPCREIYEEDLNNLNIPEWAKFFRTYGALLFGGLLFAGILISSKNHEFSKTDLA